MTAIRAEKEARRSEADRQVERVDLLASHLAFTRKFFREREGQNFGVSAFHHVVCDTLDRVFAGEITRLIINLPPGYSKTEIAVVNTIARGFAVNPRARFIHASYAEPLALDNSSKVKDIIALPGYQAHWPVRMRQDTSAKGLWRTTDGGHLRAAASGAPITGFRAGILGEGGFTGALIIDDPLKPDDASSDTLREFINSRYMNTFRSRLAHEDVPIIIVMQRIHQRDFSAHLLKGEGGEKFHHLILPVEVKPGAAYPTEYSYGIPVEHDLPAGPLWKEKQNEAQINVLRRDGRVFSAQYMQDPRLSANPVFTPENFHPYEVRPRTLNVFIMVDPSGGKTKTAGSKSKSSDRTAMAVVGIDANGNKYLLDGYCHRMNLSQRWELLASLWRRWSAAPGVQHVEVGYEQYGMQADIAYIQERQEIDGPHFAVRELNWPREGSHSKEDRIQRLEPDFKGERFFLPCRVHRVEEGGECFWKGTASGVETWRAQGPTSAQRRVTDAGEPWRVINAIKRRDETGQIYDVTWTLMQELKDFPSAQHDDLSDAVSRLYDMGSIPANRQEVDEVAALNATLEF